MISQDKRQYRPRFERENWSDPRFFRGHQRHASSMVTRAITGMETMVSRRHLSSKHCEAQRQK